MKAFVLPPQLGNALRLSGVAIDIFALIGYTFVEVGILLAPLISRECTSAFSTFFILPLVVYRIVLPSEAFAISS